MGLLNLMWNLVQDIYIFTSNGVDVNAWRKLGNSDNLAEDLKIELASKIGKQSKKLQHESIADGNILLEAVPIPTSVNHMRRNKLSRISLHIFT